MVKKLLKIIFVLILSNSIYAQETNDSELKPKSNPIIYGEAFGGFVGMKHFGLAGGGELNYQYKKHLFTLRYSHESGYVKQDSVFAFSSVEDNDEYAILYGKRWLTRNHSYSVSAGISSNNLKLSFKDSDDNYYYQYKRFVGVPFEANFKWFAPKKRSSLIFNALTPSIGLKLFGSISKNSFVGAGLVIGFGLPKEY
ncbi:hypothetical protein [Flavobacterium sp. UBA7680]|uniref:hypothetical protein n=1 Tax=Flavobacterium sp. UBA7680 TaxID=1946559 RepID=UPI0025C10FE1|nr:hypothetical protein [Flavobacterium sp. UBA7680]